MGGEGKPDVHEAHGGKTFTSSLNICSEASVDYFKPEKRRYCYSSPRCLHHVVVLTVNIISGVRGDKTPCVKFY
jgi:hypothetical protein